MTCYRERKINNTHSMNIYAEHEMCSLAESLALRASSSPSPTGIAARACAGRPFDSAPRQVATDRPHARAPIPPPRRSRYLVCDLRPIVFKIEEIDQFSDSG